jgi:hypothetical protein
MALPWKWLPRKSTFTGLEKGCQFLPGQLCHSRHAVSLRPTLSFPQKDSLGNKLICYTKTSQLIAEAVKKYREQVFVYQRVSIFNDKLLVNCYRQ